MFSGQFQVGLKKIQELLLLFDFEPLILLEIDNDAIGNRPLAAGSENLAFREHYEIVPKEKLEFVNDNLLDLFFRIELDFGIECACGSEEHEETFYVI